METRIPVADLEGVRAGFATLPLGRQTDAITGYAVMLASAKF